MNERLSLYEKKGIDEYSNKKWVWKSVILTDELYQLLAVYMDEIPNIVQPDLYMFAQTLLQLKYSLLELIGRDAK